MEAKNTQYTLSTFIIYFAYITSLILTLTIFGFIIKYSAYGIDFTDEGYYLNAISNPFLYKESVTQFGFVYHPLYLLVNENITYLRRINFLITFLLSYCLVFVFFQSFIIQKRKIFEQILIVGIATTIFLSINIFTPSYNSLNLQALIIVSIGILLAHQKNNFKNILSYTCIGVGGWLTFMAKPSSALVLIIVILIYLILSKKTSSRLIIISSLIGFFFLLLSTQMIDGSISAFIRRIHLGIIYSTKLDHEIGQSFLRTFVFINQNSKKFDQLLYTFFSIILIFIISFFYFFSILIKKKNNIFALLIISLTALAIITFLNSNIINMNAMFERYQRLQILGVIFACLCINFFVQSNKIEKFTTSHGATAIFFALIPYVYAFGTNINYFYKGLDSGIFWILAAFILVIPKIILNDKKYKIIIFLVLIIQIITYGYLQIKFESPERQNQPLRLNSSSITINNKGDTLILSKEFASYILYARYISDKAGFVKGDFIIDLSGQSPGLLYLLNATSIGTPWNLGGYTGSLDVAKAVYKTVSCKDISKSWILYEIKGPRSISTDLMKSLGVNFPKQYQYVGSWKTATGSGGYKENRVQELYKPHTNPIFQSCSILKKK